MKTIRSLFAALAAFALLAPALHGADFTNAFVTTIPANGNATPYPSTVTVPEGAVTGPVGAVQVRITGFTHTSPVDVDVFLVAPSGAVAAVFSDAGDSFGTNALNLNLLFDDAAATEIPGNASFTSGTYRPANHAPGEALPPGATGTIGTNLTALAAGGVNGNWNLYVSDDLASQAGSITSWTLSIVTPFEVTNTNDSGTGSLRWALANAAANPGPDTITFASNLPSGNINLTTNTDPGSGNTALIIADTGGITIDASGFSGGITLNGAGAAGTYRLIQVNSGSTLTLRGLTLANGGGSGFAAYGGGIANNGGTLTLERCTLRDNKVGGGPFGGGAILNNGGASILTCTQCTFSGNDFTGNPDAGSSGGGAINNRASTAATFTHCTFSGNTTNQSGGAILTTKGGTSVTLINTIVAGNTATVSGPDVGNWGAITANGKNLLSATIAGPGTVTNSGNLIVNPTTLLAPLGANGGPTQTRPPLANSPAIDAAVAVGGLTTDQRGLPRASGPAPDIGAVELQEIRVNTLADENNGIGNGSSVSLREALTSTAPGVAEVVRFAPAVFTGTPLGKNTIPLGSQISVAKSVLVDAGDIPSGVTLDGGAQNFGLIYLSNNSNLALRGLTLANGRTPSGGGAIWNDFSTLTLTRCTLSGHQALQGGAIYSTTDALTGTVTSSTMLTHCTLSGNTATDIGGAIFNSQGRTTLLHCTVSGNGIGVTSSGNAFTETVVQNSIIAGNVNSDVDFVFGNGTNSFISQGYNRIGSGNATTSPNRFNQTGDFINVAPLLAPLGDYGGPTRTMLPLPGSPAIDAATTSTATIDQRGIARPQGTARDIGAVETFTLTAPFQDTDSDGMDDRLEPLYGFIVGVQDGALDADGDGSSNAAELGNQTSPRDSTSLLRIVAFTPAGFALDGDPRFDVTWTSFPGLTYTLQAKTDLNFAVTPREADPETATGFTHTLRIELDKNNPKDFIRIRRN